jgi:hypothetical protein
MKKGKEIKRKQMKIQMIYDLFVCLCDFEDWLKFHCSSHVEKSHIE